ncbi:MAG: ATP-binding protein [bacterium]
MINSVNKYSFGAGNYALVAQSPDKEQQRYAPQMQPQHDSFVKKPKDGRSFWDRHLAAILGITSIAFLGMSLLNAKRGRLAREMMEKAQRGGEELQNSMGPKLTRETVFENYAKDDNIASFKDLPGMKEEKKILQRDVIDAVKYEDIYKATGAGTVNALILHGPAGTGKTNLIKVLAKELDAEVAKFAIAKDGSPFVNQNSINLNNRADFIKKEALANPEKQYIAFFDEIEGMLTEDKSGSNPHRQELIKTVLILLDDFKNIPNIRVAATTNETLNKSTGFFANMNEPAMDRFPVKIFIDNPDKDARTAALKYHLKKTPHAKDLVQNPRLMNNISDELEGYSHRNIEQIADSARRILTEDIKNARIAKKSEDIPLSKKHFDTAIEEFRKSKDPAVEG